MRQVDESDFVWDLIGTYYLMIDQVAETLLNPFGDDDEV